MISRNIALLLASLCIAPAHAGDDSSFALQKTDPYLRFALAHLQEWFARPLPPTVTQSQIDGFELVDEEDLIGKPSTTTITFRRFAPKKVNLPEDTIAHEVYAERTQAENPWITQSKHIKHSKMRCFDNNNQSVSAKIDKHEPLLIEDEDSLEMYESRKEHGKYQHFLNHHYQGSYHNHLQENARIAHILDKRTDINPTRNHADAAIHHTKKHESGLLSNQPQWTLPQTSVRAHNSTAISTAPQTQSIPQISVFQSQLALTCHILMHHYATIINTK